MRQKCPCLPHCWTFKGEGYRLQIIWSLMTLLLRVFINLGHNRYMSNNYAFGILQRLPVLAKRQLYRNTMLSFFQKDVNYLLVLGLTQKYSNLSNRLWFGTMSNAFADLHHLPLSHGRMKHITHSNIMDNIYR